MLSIRAVTIFAVAALSLSGCASPRLPSTDAELLPQLRPGIVAGYLPREAAVDSLRLLPPPPAPGSAAQAADEEAFRDALANRGSSRWQLAARDADLSFPAMLEPFRCALGVDPAGSPHMAMLLRRTAADAGMATYRAKKQYQRMRPFVAHNEVTCTPEEEHELRNDGSYPSGHAALGWAIGMVLVELAPERADAIAQRVHAFGQSRVACGVHWQSDVVAGREVAAAVVAQLHARPDFLAQLGEARKELASARTSAAQSAAGCADESSAPISETARRAGTN